MEDLVNLITNNGIGIVCVAYLIYFQSTTMKNMLDTLSSINNRLSIIEDRMAGRRRRENETSETRVA